MDNLPTYNTKVKNVCVELYLHSPICFNDMVLKHKGQLLPIPVAGILDQGLDVKDRELKFGSTYYI